MAWSLRVQWAEEKEKRHRKEVLPKWPGEALQTLKSGVYTEFTIRMTHRRPVCASAEPGKQRGRGGKFRRRASSLNGLLGRGMRCLLSGWYVNHHQISKILERLAQKQWGAKDHFCAEE